PCRVYEAKQHTPSSLWLKCVCVWSDYPPALPLCGVSLTREYVGQWRVASLCYRDDSSDSGSKQWLLGGPGACRE
ncbi:hypothetical protein KUCAC02_037412, partial [Chaenocephalus aceratus]